MELEEIAESLLEAPEWAEGFHGFEEEDLHDPAPAWVDAYEC